MVFVKFIKNIEIKRQKWSPKALCHALALAFLLCPFWLLAQDYYLPFNNLSDIRIERSGVYEQPGVHGGIKPVYRVGTDVSNVSGLGPDTAKYYYKFVEKIFSEHLIELDKGGLKLNADFIFDFGYGQEMETFNDDGDDLFVNTRGFAISGQIGDKVFFYTDLRENQARFPSYLDAFVDSLEVVPGNGRIKPFKDTGYDFSMANGYVGINAAKWLQIQFGHHKSFVGHGYRSVLLSDNSFNMPFAGYTINLFENKLKYTYQINLLQNLERLPVGEAPESLFKRKYMSYSYLSWEPFEKLELGLFESVVWKQFDDSTGTEPFQAQALNPIPLLNSAVLGLDDPDNNALVGFNIGYRPTNWLKLYGQAMLDDLDGERYGYQVGAKFIEALPRIDIQLEYNAVSEGAYASSNALQGYTHFNQPLAHPLGAGFEEVQAVATYLHKRWYAQARIAYSTYSDRGRDPLSSADLDQMYDLENVFYQDYQCAYIFNPTTNMQLYAGITSRTADYLDYNTDNLFWYFGFRTRLANVYRDF